MPPGAACLEVTKIKIRHLRISISHTVFVRTGGAEGMRTKKVCRIGMFGRLKKFI